MSKSEKRNMFAAHAIQGLLAAREPTIPVPEQLREKLVKEAFAIADLMVEEQMEYASAKNGPSKGTSHADYVRKRAEFEKKRGF